MELISNMGNLKLPFTEMYFLSDSKMCKGEHYHNKIYPPISRSPGVQSIKM